jgi:hypothetical protein
MDPLSQNDIPIYFDTSVLWYPTRIAALRERWPNRDFCVPAIAHFERVRQLQLEYRAQFDEAVIQDFIVARRLILVDLTQAAANLVARMAVRIEQSEGLPWVPHWPRERRDVSRYPCGQRCRLGDFAIAAITKVEDGLLLTNDKEMLLACKHHPDLFPVALTLDEVEAQLGDVPV